MTSANPTSTPPPQRLFKPTTAHTGPLVVDRKYTQENVDVYDQFNFVSRPSKISNMDGTNVFELESVEVPDFWDQTSTDILASKYFRRTGVPQTDENGNLLKDTQGNPVLGSEHSAKQVMGRLADAWAHWGQKRGYFASEQDKDAFRDEMLYMLLAQIAAPNTPQFFNTGIFETYHIEASPDGNWFVDEDDGNQVRQSTHRYERSSVSACYISSIGDSLVGEGSIFEFLQNEARLFKSGSGSGANFSDIRGLGEPLSGGGTSSGVMSFLKVGDASAGAVKSGGSTRRAAKMVILDADHPEIEEFIWCKVEEEKKVAALAKAGWDTDFNGEAYATVAFQNGNNSVRIPEGFMSVLAEGGDWALIARTTGETMKTVKAQNLWDAIAEAAWSCADPGVQFDDILNDWNTAADTERVRGTNPCFVGETLISTTEGLIRIDELNQRVNNGEMIGIYTHNATNDKTPDTGVVTSSIDHIEPTGYNLVVALRFDDGNEITCTRNHRFWTLNRGWVEAENLTGKDEVLKVSSGETPVADSNASFEKAGTTNTKATTVDEKATCKLVVRTKKGLALTYNLCEPKNHSYIANMLAVSNCSEFTHVDDTSCNLASLNLVKFLNEETGMFDVDSFLHAVDLWQMTLDISISMAHFPSKIIAEKSFEHRTTGLGFANLGACLMRNGIAYDSPGGRNTAAAIMSLLNSRSWQMSARLAGALGAAPVYLDNEKSLNRVLRNHQRAAVGSLASRQKSEDFEQLTVRPVEIDHGELLHTPFDNLSRPVIEQAQAMVEQVKQTGARNMQVSLLAPTGTIALLMGCDTTGVEPDFALVKLKKLAGGGYMQITNQSVTPALQTLGYTPRQIQKITEHLSGTKKLTDQTSVSPTRLHKAGVDVDIIAKIEKAVGVTSNLSDAFEAHVVGEQLYVDNGLDVRVNTGRDLLLELGFTSVEIDETSRETCGHLSLAGAPYLKDEHRNVFDCAVTCGEDTRSIAWEGHVRMLGAVMPHLSGAVSKTINMPWDVEVEDVKRAHEMAYDLGVKCVAIYRDGSKLSQPLNSAQMSVDIEKAVIPPVEIPPGVSPSEFYKGQVPPRFKLPSLRAGLTWRLEVGGEEVYLRSGEYPDGTLGEIFIDWGAQGTTMRGLTSTLSIALSQALQHGVPLERFVKAFRSQTFEPRGLVGGHPNLKMADSVVDAIVRVLGHYYLGRSDLVQVKEGGVVSPTITDKYTSDHPADSLPKNLTGEGFERDNSVAVDQPGREPKTAGVPAETTTQREETSRTQERLYGQSCPACGGHNLVKAGTCAVCGDCGETTGCS